ncbi:MAG: hypothetical protein ABMA64_18875 [Myxococcota bacterium]
MFWQGITSAHARGGWVEGTLSERVDGGYAVHLGGSFARGYRSENAGDAWLRTSEPLDAWLGSRVQCEVRSYDPERGGVVLSLDVARERARRATLGALVPGAELVGVVTVVAEYGASVELEGFPAELRNFDVMLHATDFGPEGPPRAGSRMLVTPTQAWTTTQGGSLFFVQRVE